MLKIILIALAFCTLSFGSFYTGSGENSVALIIKELDIDEDFLKDEALFSRNADFETTRKNEFIDVLENSHKILPVIKKMFYEAKMPQSLVYLAMAESEFNQRLMMKRSKATGIWQFIPSTGKLYGLRIDGNIDERKDPIKSTKAAIKYLNDLHDMFGKWYLVVFAYNCGEGRVKQAIRRAGTDELDALLDQDKKYLPKESRIYLRKIISYATTASSNSVFADSETSNLAAGGAAKTVQSVQIACGNKLSEIAKLVGMEKKELVILNSQVKSDIVPAQRDKGGCEIYLPYEKIAAFKENYELANLQTYNEKLVADSNKYIVYRIKKGDTIESIAKKYDVSVKKLTDLNRLKKGKKLQFNAKLKIPDDSES